jgi:Protein of unknown function (DUF3638)
MSRTQGARKLQTQLRCVQVLQRLEIRPRQLHVAEHLLANLEAQAAGADPDSAVKGAIVQLNMGEGKTWVILPLLVLALARNGELVRLNFLGELLPDAAAGFERMLTGARRVTLCCCPARAAPRSGSWVLDVDR